MNELDQEILGMDTKFTEFTLGREMKPMSEGIHIFQLVDVKETVGGSGHPNMSFTCECCEDSQWNGQKVWMNVSLSPQARWKLEEFLNALGAPESGRRIGILKRWPPA